MTTIVGLLLVLIVVVGAVLVIVGAECDEPMVLFSGGLMAILATLALFVFAPEGLDCTLTEVKVTVDGDKYCVPREEVAKWMQK